MFFISLFLFFSPTVLPLSSAPFHVCTLQAPPLSNRLPDSKKQLYSTMTPLTSPESSESWDSEDVKKDPVQNTSDAGSTPKFQRTLKHTTTIIFDRIQRKDVSDMIRILIRKLIRKIFETEVSIFEHFYVRVI